MTWERVGEAPELEQGVVHLWRLALDAASVEAWSLLSTDEQQRADRFAVGDARRRFVQRRAFLRRVLGRYTRQDPGALAFRYGPLGKPELHGEGRGLRFNQSDSVDWTVVAACLDASIGVDVEVVRQIDTATLASEVFTPREQAQLATSPESSRLRTFFNGWTRKEALIKADGRGLAFPLLEVEVSLTPDEPAKLLRVPSEMGSIEDWTLLSFEVAAGVIGAVVMHQPGMTLRLLDLTS